MPDLDVNGARLHYEIDGAGLETIVLCHGLLFSSRMFDEQVAALKDRYRCVRFDFRGQGESEVTDGGYDMDSLAADTISLIEQLDLGPVHLVGFSMGGFVCQRVALSRPDLMRSLTLMNTSAEREAAKKRPRYLLLNFMARWFGLKVVANRIMPILFSHRFIHSPELAERRTRWRGYLIANNRIGVTRAVRGVIDRQPVIDHIEKIQAPTLIITSDQDAATPRIKSQHMHTKIRGSRLMTIENAGHMTPAERPEQVNETLRSFLDEQSAGADGG